MNKPQIVLDDRNMSELGMEQSIFTQWDQEEFSVSVVTPPDPPQLQKKEYMALALPAPAIYRRIYFYMEFSYGAAQAALHRIDAVLRFTRNNRLLSEIPVGYLFDQALSSYDESRACVSGTSAVVSPDTINVALSKKFRKAAGTRVVTLNPFALTVNADKVSFELKNSYGIWYIASFLGVMSRNRQ